MISYNTPLLDSPRRGDRNCLVNFIASIGILIEVGAIFSIFAGHDNYLWIYLILKPIPVVLLANIPTTTLLSTSARRMTPLNALLAIFYLALCTTNLVLLIGGTLDMHAGRAVVRGCLTHRQEYNITVNCDEIKSACYNILKKNVDAFRNKAIVC